MNTYNISFIGSLEALLDNLRQLASFDVVQVFGGLNVVSILTNVPIEELRMVSGVAHVELDAPLVLSPHGWHQQRISTTFLPLPAEPKRLNDGEGSVVYLIDTAVDTSHPEFEGAQVETLWSHDGQFTQGDTVHGTMVASLIVGKTIGVAPRATVKTLSIVFGSVSISTLLSALDAILNDSSRPQTSVLNCSWGIPKSFLLDSKISELQNAGIVVVAAAGNAGIKADDISPVGLDTALGVGASDAYDRVMPWDGGTNNWGPEVDVFAPAIDIPVVFGSTIAEKSGTSLAAGVASGVVAQFINKHPHLSAAEIQQMVVNRSTPDALFRNEVVYGTTPNRVLQQVKAGIEDFWSFDEQSEPLIFVQQGVQKTITLNRKAPVAHAAYVSIKNGNKTIVPFEWVSATNETDNQTRLDILPPLSLPVGKYIVIITGYDANIDSVSRLWLRLGVYADSPAELTEQAEWYATKDSVDGVVQLSPYVDCCTLGCPKDSFCCSDTGESNTFTCLEATREFCC